MAGKNSVVQENTLLVRWRNDRASFKKVKKELATGFSELKSHSPFAALKPSDIAKTQMQYRRMLRQMKKDRDKILGADFKVSVSGKGSGSGRGSVNDKAMHPNRTDYAKHLQQQAKEQNSVEKAIQQRQDRELKREMDLYKIQQKRTREQEKQGKPKVDNWEAKRERFTGTRAYQTQGLRYEKPTTDLQHSVVQARSGIEAAKSSDQYNAAVERLNTALARNTEAQRRANAAKRNGTVLNERLAASTTQLVGELASVYVAYEGIKSVVSTGMEFEKINKMLLSVSDSSAAAGENFEFLKGQALRLGLDLKQSGKEYSKYLANVNDSFSKTQSQELFVSMSELATVRGLTPDEIGRANKAITDMLGKGKLQAEELSGQLPEAGIADAYNMMARAAKEAGVITGKTISEQVANLNKLMQQGKALSYEILPYFTKQLHEAARKNDALNYALKRLFSVQLGRAKLNMQLFSNEIWKGGLLEGMQQLLKVFNDFSILSQPFAKFIGVTLRNAMITVTAPFEIVLQLVKDIAAAFGVEFDGSMATQLAKITGVLVSLIALSAGVRVIAGSCKFLFGILGGSAATSAISKMGLLHKALSKFLLAYEAFDLIANAETNTTSENIIGGMKVGGAAALMTPAAPYGAAMLAAAYGSEAIMWCLDKVGVNFDKPDPSTPPQLPTFQPYGMGQQTPVTSMYGGYSVPQKVDVNLTVKGTDGLIEVIQETSSNVVTDTMNHNQQRLTRGRE